jgi:predicted ATPase
MPPPPHGQHPYAFVSYANADRERVLPVVAALEQAGIAVWIDQTGIAGGSNYGPEIVAAIRDARAVLVMCSASAFASRNVRQEVALAWKHARPILQLRLEPVESPADLEYWLEAAQWIDVLDRPLAAWWPDVARGLQRLGFEPEREAAAPAAPKPRRRPTLPVSATSLLGREREVDAVVAALATARLVTLTGPGGAGKTRLAVEAATRLAPRFAGNVAFVDLAPVRERSLVLATIAQAVDVYDLGGRPVREGLRLRFAGEPWLVVIDNFEHVLDEAPLLADLLADSPDLQLLATSRAVLRLRAEREIAVPALAPAAARALFGERARAARPGFAVTADNEGTVAEICRRLDGLPLAIELAAARAKLLSPQALLARMERSLPMLTGGARDLPARQQTLRNAIAWSYDLLSPEEQRLFRRLAVFVGGWTLDAAEAVCVLADGAPDLLDVLASLLDKSLVTQSEGTDGEPRFGMLETVREFGLERLAASGDEEAVRDRHTAWCLALAEHREIGPTFPNLKQWLHQIDREISNVRAALARLDQRDQAVMRLRLAAEMCTYWWLIGPIGEGRAWLEAALPRADDASPAIRVKALVSGGWLVFQQGDVHRYHELATEGLMLARRTGDRPHEIYGLLQLGKIAEVKIDFDLAQLRYAEALDIARTLDRNDLIGFALQQIGYLAWEQGDLARSSSILSEALVHCKEGGDRFFVAAVLWRLGRATRDQGDAARAYSLIRESIAMWAEIGRISFIGHALVDLASIIAGVGHHERAAGLLGAAERIRESVGVPVMSSDEARYVASVAIVRAALGENVFGDAYRRGRELPWEQVIAEALADPEPVA